MYGEKMKGTNTQFGFAVVHGKGTEYSTSSQVEHMSTACCSC